MSLSVSVRAMSLLLQVRTEIVQFGLNATAQVRLHVKQFYA
jgi:hypothetical protein